MVRWRHGRGFFLGTLLVLIAACTPVVDRPRSGASQGSTAAPTGNLPPTLSSSGVQFAPAAPPSAAPSPAVTNVPTPAAPPSAAPLGPPIIRSLQPAPNSVVSGSSVIVSAALQGRGADLATASLSLDGGLMTTQVDRPSARDWTIHGSISVTHGSHSARVNVQDAAGGTGGYTWDFTVGDSEPLTRPGNPPAAPRSSPIPRP